jgi:hypothetical protein
LELYSIKGCRAKLLKFCEQYQASLRRTLEKRCQHVELNCTNMRNLGLYQEWNIVLKKVLSNKTTLPVLFLDLGNVALFY